MKAKERHRQDLLSYLSNPENKFLPPQTLATEVLGFKNPQSIWNAFSSDELHEIYMEALEYRRKRYTWDLSDINLALLKEAKAGNIQAIKLCYQS